MYNKLSALALILGAVNAQKACSSTKETQPKLNWSRCSEGGSCSEVDASVVLDSNWRWTHTVEGSTNCYDGNAWDESICPDGETCAQECCLDGADYQSTYGIQTDGESLSLRFVTEHAYGKNVGSRVYLMEDADNYQMFDLLGNEFTFDVDVSNVGCGLNGALYFVTMEQDGGLSSYPGNEAGARYGTGYCDSQCPRDIKFIAGRANVEGWNPSETDPNGGVGNTGTCCAEMDIWEANSKATAYTPHPCTNNAPHTCEGDSCGGTYSSDRYGGTCDPDGCDFNAWRQGNDTFYGPGLTIDTNKKMTVVTQFHTDSSGGLADIRRLYVQDGVVFENAESEIPGNPGNAINAEFCTAQKEAFGDQDIYQKHGGHAQMSDALAMPMVLVMSLWDDGYANMRWLDSTYPETSTELGAERGPCPTDGGVPDELREEVPDSSVVFSNIRFGPIGSTFSSDGSGPENPNPGNPDPPTSTSSAPAPGGTGAARWTQCGGTGWSGPKTCEEPWECTVINEWYHQCT